jgi:hypothetical protein
LRIAIYGYSAQGDERAFFPLYPSLAALLSKISGLDVLAAGLIISSLSFLAAGLLLYVIVHDLWGQTSAMVSVASLFFSPFAFFFFAFYPESLLLSLSLASYWTARRGNFLLSGLCIAFAGMTRPVGWTLVVPYLLFLLHRENLRWTRLFPALLGLLFAAAGTTLVLAVIIPIQHDDWRFWAGYSALLANSWKTYFAYPWVTLHDAVFSLLTGEDIGSDWFSRASSSVDLVSAIFLVAACITLARKIPLGMYAFLLTSAILLLATHGPHGYALFSMPRHVLLVYPVLLVPALLIYSKSRLLWYGLLGLSCACLVVSSAWFSSGRWIA